LSIFNLIWFFKQHQASREYAVCQENHSGTRDRNDGQAFLGGISMLGCKALWGQSIVDKLIEDKKVPNH
jgi:hypothetical protein